MIKPANFPFTAYPHPFLNYICFHFLVGIFFQHQQWLNYGGKHFSHQNWEVIFDYHLVQPVCSSLIPPMAWKRGCFIDTACWRCVWCFCKYFWSNMCVRGPSVCIQSGGWALWGLICPICPCCELLAAVVGFLHQYTFVQPRPPLFFQSNSTRAGNIV